LIRKRGGSDGGKNRETEKMGFADKEKRRPLSDKKLRNRKQALRIRKSGDCGRIKK
jgi:hypothetical protein